MPSAAAHVCLCAQTDLHLFVLCKPKEHRYETHMLDFTTLNGGLPLTRVKLGMWGGRAPPLLTPLCVAACSRQRGEENHERQHLQAHFKICAGVCDAERHDDEL